MADKAAIGSILAEGVNGKYHKTMTTPLDVTALTQSLTSLEEVVARYTDPKFMNTLDDWAQAGFAAGVIQNFEFCYELAWKFMRRWLEQQEGAERVSGVPRRELYRIAHKYGLIDSVDRWMDYHEHRNLTSHTYSQVVATEVAHSAVEFLEDYRHLVNVLSKHNEQ